jgi:hypothetical protein
MNDNLQQLAGLAQQYQQAYQSGQISGAEYKELVGNLNLAEQVNQQAEDLAEDIMARQVIMGALQIASALA